MKYCLIQPKKYRIAKKSYLKEKSNSVLLSAILKENIINKTKIQ